MILKLKIHALCTTLDNTKLTTTRASLTLPLPLGESHTELSILIGLSSSVKSEIEIIISMDCTHVHVCTHSTKSSGIWSRLVLLDSSNCMTHVQSQHKKDHCMYMLYLLWSDVDLAIKTNKEVSIDLIRLLSSPTHPSYKMLHVLVPLL